MISCKSIFLLACCFLIPCLSANAQNTGAGTWKTAYVKRGFMGELAAPDAVIRSLLTLPMDGTKVRIYIQPSMGTATFQLARISLAQAADSAGTITPPPYTVTFAGQPGLQIPPNRDHPPVTVSDDVTMPVTAGLWYLQESFAPGSKTPYSYDVDGGFRAASHEAPTADKKDWRGGVTWRVDVLTTDPRPVIACYGDSITQGYGATPLSGNRYPDLLAKELNQPTLNAGVNGDTLVNQVGRCPGFIKDTAGVEVVVVLLGINDIMTGQIKSVDDYAKRAQPLIDALHREGKKVVWGTLGPGTGNEMFAKFPDAETLRQSINAWIRANSVGAEAVADFDAALKDPKDPKLLYWEYQKDWLHPNDAGNQVLAKVAADAVRKVEAAPAPAVKQGA